jgi:hypothetical protein
MMVDPGWHRTQRRFVPCLSSGLLSRLPLAVGLHERRHIGSRGGVGRGLTLELLDLLLEPLDMGVLLRDADVAHAQFVLKAADQRFQMLDRAFKPVDFVALRRHERRK